MRGGLDRARPRVEPATLHRLAPVEEHGENEECHQGEEGHEQPLLEGTFCQKQGPLYEGCLLILVVGLHVDVGEPGRLLELMVQHLRRRVRIVVRGCSRLRHLTLG